MKSAVFDGTEYSVSI